MLKNVHVDATAMTGAVKVNARDLVFKIGRKVRAGVVEVGDRDAVLEIDIFTEDKIASRSLHGDRVKRHPSQGCWNVPQR